MQQIQDFLQSRVLAVHLNTKLLGQEFEQFLEQCYLKINNNRLKKESNDDLKNKYVELQRLIPQPKPENMDLLIFIAGYLVHKKLHSQAADDQKNIYDLRLLLDIYHILIFTVNGIMVSDTFLETCIGKFFQPHFFDYTKKIVYIPPYIKPTKFFGRPIIQTQPTSPEANDLATTFTNMFKPIRKKQAISIQDTQQEFHYELISPPVRKHKININSLSPSMANALKIDTVSQPRMVNHPMQKANFGEHKVLQRLKQLNEVNQQKPEPRLPSRKVRNIFEEHGLVPPPKDFFQRSKKVDPYMRPFLEHNYVLDNRLQNMQTLPSSQIAPSDLLIKQELPQVQKGQKQIVTQTEFNFDPEAQISLKSTLNGFDIQAATTKASLPQFSNYSTFYKEPNQTQPLLGPLKKNKKLKKSVSEFTYDNKIQFYQTQFDKAMHNVSTDLKISELQQKLQKQTNFMAKHMGKLAKATK